MAENKSIKSIQFYMEYKTDPKHKAWRRSTPNKTLKETTDQISRCRESRWHKNSVFRVVQSTTVEEIVN
jgi:hypothetical protein